MARVKYSAIVESVTGSLAGSTFAFSGSGQVLRSKSNSATKPKRNSERNLYLFSVIANSWRRLTTAQRTAWTNFSRNSFLFDTNKDGNIKTTFQVYQIIQYYSLLRNMGINKTVPTNLAKPRIKNLVLNIVSATNVMTVNIITYAPVGASDMFVYATAPQKGHTGRTKDNYQLIQQIGFNMGGTFSLSANYVLKYGRFPAVGEEVKFRFVAVLRANNIPTPKIYLGKKAT